MLRSAKADGYNIFVAACLITKCSVEWGVSSVKMSECIFFFSNGLCDRAYVLFEVFFCLLIFKFSLFAYFRSKEFRVGNSLVEKKLNKITRIALIEIVASTRCTFRCKLKDILIFLLFIQLVNLS